MRYLDILVFAILNVDSTSAQPTITFKFTAYRVLDNSDSHLTSFFLQSEISF